MSDAVRPDSQKVEELLWRSRTLWSLYAADISRQLPTQCVQLQSLVSRMPAFPTNTSALEYSHTHFGLQVSGVSTWRTSTGDCNLPSKVLRHELIYGVFDSVGCSFAKNSRFLDWPGIQEDGHTSDKDRGTSKGNHLAILLQAWAYILSAIWVESQSIIAQGDSGPSVEMSYSDVQASRLGEHEIRASNDIEIDVGNACERDYRWWSAILAPGEGWHAKMSLRGQAYKSPWSAHINSHHLLKLRNQKPTSGGGFHTPLSSNEALGILQGYCDLHGIHSQCIPALSAALHLPWRNIDDGASAVIPCPKPLARVQKHKTLHIERSLQSDVRLLPYYMVLSCNPRGLRAVLSSSFFDPTVSCNLVSPWMQPIFETIDPIIARGDFLSFATIMSRRQPNVAGLWLGAIIIGVEKSVLLPIRNGQFAVEPHAAAWTATIHSFINKNPQTPHAIDDKNIKRSDECFLLHLLGSKLHQKVPICPWQPFGVTPLCFADIEVRLHAKCKGHCLQYKSWCWDTIGGSSYEDLCSDNDAIVTLSNNPPTDITSMRYSYEQACTLRSEHLSEVATRNIFNWLRADGYPTNERSIFQHDWFDVGDSSEESSESDNNSPATNHTFMTTKNWLDRVE